MKPHKFNELVNDIRFLAQNFISATEISRFYYLLSRHCEFQNRPCNDVYEICNVCLLYVNTQQLRGHIVKVLEKIGIKPDHEHNRRLEVAQAGFDMALSLKNKREQGPGPCLA